MHINFDAVYKGDSKFACETRKTQTALIGFFSDEQTRNFDALADNYTSAHTQVFEIH